MDRADFSELRSTRLIVRRLRLTDAPALAAYRSRPEVARYQSWETFDVAAARDLAASQEFAEPDRPGTWFQVGIVEAESGTLVGDCGLQFRDDDHRQVEVGVTLDPAHQGRGFAAEALSLLLGYLFDTLGKHRVIAITDAENRAAANLFATLGFRREGHFIDHIWFKGTYGSEFLFALLQRDWRAGALHHSTGEAPDPASSAALVVEEVVDPSRRGGVDAGDLFEVGQGGA